jgi:putative membrane protein
MDSWKRPVIEHGANMLRGALMGAADIVPGVSGGTVALILGIYERLVGAISRFDWQLVILVRRGRWLPAARHVDLGFLGSLGVGILAGMVVMTTLMHYLLSTERTSALTMALFFGLIAASAYVVARMVTATSRGQWGLIWLVGLGGVGFAWWIAGLGRGHVSDPHLGFIFFAACVAICAMILPGISGAMILWILGVYLHMTEIPGHLIRGRAVPESLETLVVFGLGCAVGLLTFSKILRWLLRSYRMTTLAVLCGFMVGSLRKLWPFREDLTPEVAELKLKTFRPILPAQWDAHTVGVVAVAALAAAIVLLADWYARRVAHGVASAGRNDLA